jgi:hypothetical protein
MTEAEHLDAVLRELAEGHVYRTKELARWSANPTRLAKRLVQEGVLRQLAQGLFFRPARSRFGEVPPTDEEVMRGFLDGAPFVFTGPDRWNALGLGTTALFAVPLVYNTKRSGTFKLGGRPYLLRRVRFPRKPSAEWAVVDLTENHQQVGASLDDLQRALTEALRRGQFDRKRLHAVALEYGTRITRDLVEAALRESTA